MVAHIKREIANVEWRLHHLRWDGVLVVQKGVGFDQLGEAEVGRQCKTMFAALLQVSDGAVKVTLTDSLVVNIHSGAAELRVRNDQVAEGGD